MTAPDQRPHAGDDAAGDPVDRVFADIEITPDAHEALQRIAALRQVLDDVERVQVSRALDGGLSLAAAGRALGISRQAMHRRYGDLSAAAKQKRTRTPQPPVAPPAGGLVITPEARLVLRHAISEAQAAGQPSVEGEHVLVALLRPPALPVLDDAGITLERARSHILGASISAGAFAREGDRPDSRALLIAATRQAQATETDEITPELLLRTALADPDGAAARTLRALGVDRDALIAGLA
jgi:hypothetical protein